MPLQNRVDPFGKIFATSARGLLMGNRGCLHDEHRLVVRPWKVKPWVTCQLAYGGRRRTLMRPGFYTELFFLDEATAFAAGHRPCGECRNAEYKRFKAGAAHGQADAKPIRTVAELDDLLHATRMAPRRQGLVSQLPDGVMVADDAGAPWLKWRDRLLLWTPDGYGRAAQTSETATILTPPPMIAVLRSGYVPIVHGSALAHVAS